MRTVRAIWHLEMLFGRCLRRISVRRAEEYLSEVLAALIGNPAHVESDYAECPPR